jgi:hypothetical protein
VPVLDTAPHSEAAALDAARCADLVLVPWREPPPVTLQSRRSMFEVAIKAAQENAGSGPLTAGRANAPFFGPIRTRGRRVRQFMRYSHQEDVRTSRPARRYRGMTGRMIRDGVAGP